MSQQSMYTKQETKLNRKCKKIYKISKKFLANSKRPPINPIQSQPIINVGTYNPTISIISALSMMMRRGRS